MGLIHAALSAAGGVMADQWKEFFYCDAMDEQTLMTRGRKKLGGTHAGSNLFGEDNIISNGSVIAVADGQCMLLVEQGKVVEFCAEPGEFRWDSSTEPSLFAGQFGDSLKETFRAIGRRFSFGGSTGKDQRVYYINTKELVGNKYGTANPVPFRVVDTNIGLDVDIALQPAFAKISAMGIRYSAVPGHTAELAQALNEELSEKWRKLRGIEIVSLGISSLTASDEDEEKIKELQMSAALRNPTMAAATLTAAQAQAMRDAAKNTAAGPAMAFMGMNMAGQAGGIDAAGLYRMGAAAEAAGQQARNGVAQQSAGQTAAPGMTAGRAAGAAASSAGANGGSQTGAAWTCPQCGAVNTGNFCSECGTKRPAPAGVVKCPGCGKEYPAGTVPKFCPECGTKLQ